MHARSGLTDTSLLPCLQTPPITQDGVIVCAEFEALLREVWTQHSAVLVEKAVRYYRLELITFATSPC